MVCLRNISVDTLHKGDTDDDDNNNLDKFVPETLNHKDTCGSGDISESTIIYAIR